MSVLLISSAIEFPNRKPPPRCWLIRVTVGCEKVQDVIMITECLSGALPNLSRACIVDWHCHCIQRPGQALRHCLLLAIGDHAVLIPPTCIDGLSQFAAPDAQVDGTAGPFEFITYEETAELVAAIGSALSAVGVKAHDKCSIYGGNSAEWMIAMQV